MRPYFLVVFMSLENVVEIHDMAINRFGGRSGIHNKGLLESAVNHPWMVLEFGSEEDLEIYNLAAVYFFHIIKNHPFVDGNKRTGVLTAIDFLFVNGYELDGNFEYLYESLYQLALNTAMSKASKEEIASFFKQVIKKIE